MAAQLLAHLVAQCLDLLVVQIERQFQMLKMRRPLYFIDLLADVAGVFGGDFNLFDHLMGKVFTQFGNQCFT